MNLVIFSSTSGSNVMAYYDPKKTTMTFAEGLRAIAKFLAFVIIASVLNWAWYEWRESNWASHERMTSVQAKGWQVGEYKLCVTVSRKELKYPLLLQKHEKQPEIKMHWKCRKNTEGEPAITCELEAR